VHWVGTRAGVGARSSDPHSGCLTEGVILGPARCGVDLANFGPAGQPSALVELARAAEDAGWDGIFLWDHVARIEGDVDVTEPWVALGAMAAATSLVTLGPLVTPLARRRPWNVARAAVTLDHLSGGRAVLGVGLGTPRGPEFTAFGEEADPRVRGDLLDEALGLIRDAWSGAPVNHAGHWRIDGVRFLPTPLKPGGIPLWAATESVRGRPVRRAARLDGVFPTRIDREDIPALVAALAEARREQGIPHSPGPLIKLTSTSLATQSAPARRAA
jgi:alkanesulfonate monooxygenase SsuD/methylene tetrahydromethanopterin reductase-like flavin-dependent oxidoreductase (luciferase family)